MSESYKLQKSIKTESNEICEIVFDWDKLSARDYKQILAVESRLGNKAIDLSLKETSSEFRIATAWVCACKSTPGLMDFMIDTLDLRDLLKLEEYGIFFMSNV